MTPLGDVFGVFQKKGLVEKVKGNEKLSLFIGTGVVCACIWSNLWIQYGDKH